MYHQDMLQGSTEPGFGNCDWDHEILPIGPANEIRTGTSVCQVSVMGTGSGMDFNKSI